ncbi:hypothetical protein ASG76_09465 [Nocardioides sp. Soil774]|uniref:SRPBCC domain-containing protein n=1 Tax=Nocardioides sp. Soil774 TaxID=1736408 RepID=UPI0007020172|nr:SRPBCC domain-containing protein [Nocardioides sp. Soil774]KRE94634.1 hypothetical protein ASG76_09465 [Nocardioides sp. Soil774]
MSLEPIVAEVTVPVTPTEAFVGFTAQMGEWWDPMLTPDPPTFSSIAIDPDGPVETVHDDDQRYTWGRVDGWDPLGHLVMEFWLGHDQAEPTRLDVRFTEEGTGTRVRLVHSDWADGSEQVRAKYTHWDDLLARYAAFVS